MKVVSKQRVSTKDFRQQTLHKLWHLKPKLKIKKESVHFEIVGQGRGDHSNDSIKDKSGLVSQQSTEELEPIQNSVLFTPQDAQDV